MCSNDELQYVQQLARVDVGNEERKVSKKCDGYNVDHTKKPGRLG